MNFTTKLIHALHPSERRCFNRKEAASYVGISTGSFDKLVKKGEMPAPLELLGRKVWDRSALDAIIDKRSGHSSPAADGLSPLDAWRRRHGHS
jgi:predicted DNA-binding transcriptional regulator AlpA